MHTFIELLFRGCVYMLFGITLEVISTAVCKVYSDGWNNKTKVMNGDTSLWMLPVYGIGILLFFEPLYSIIYFFPSYIRFIIWGIGFMCVEFSVGLAYDKLFHIRPWDYSKDEGNIMGYTKISLFTFWGWGSLWIESLYQLLLYVSPTVSKYFGY